jgi:drug/metabolite transporter (DMT)-like permease
LVCHYIWISGILSGIIVFGGEIFKRIGLSLLELSILVYFPSIFFLFPFLKGKRSQIFNIQNIKLLLLWSLFAGLTVIFQFGSIVAGAPVAIVVLLLYTQPIWTIIISKFFYKEKIIKKDVIALIPAILGVLILVNPWSLRAIGNPTGVILALCGGLALSGWITVGNHVGKSKIDPYVSKFMETILEIVLITAILLATSFVIKRPDIVEFRLNWSIQIWAALILFSLITQVINHVLYLKGSKVVPATEAGIIMLLEPVSGAILAALFLNQAITLNIFVGGVLILIANYFVLTQKTKVTMPDFKEIAK